MATAVTIAPTTDSTEVHVAAAVLKESTPGTATPTEGGETDAAVAPMITIEPKHNVIDISTLTHANAAQILSAFPLMNMSQFAGSGTPLTMTTPSGQPVTFTATPINFGGTPISISGGNLTLMNAAPLNVVSGALPSMNATPINMSSALSLSALPMTVSTTNLAASTQPQLVTMQTMEPVPIETVGEPASSPSPSSPHAHEDDDLEDESTTITVVPGGQEGKHTGKLISIFSFTFVLRSNLHILFHFVFSRRVN